MATSLISSATAPRPFTTTESRTKEQLGSSSFICGVPNKLHSAPSLYLLCSRRTATRRFVSPSASNQFNHIPKQFREENLPDELMGNYKNVPSHLYGLSPAQLEMFNTEDSPIGRQSKNVTEESISAAYNYMQGGGMWSMSGVTDSVQSKYGMSMAMTMYRGGRGGGFGGRARSAPPDLPSLLLDSRVCYLGMPMVPAVTELIVAQLMWLDYDNPSKPVYIYLNSSGIQDNNGRLVGSESDAYAIADMMLLCKSKIYTINIAKAYGQAAMILSLGAKGYRALQPNSSTRLYLPKVNRSSGQASDMWIKARELDVNTGYYLDLLAQGIGKPKEEIVEYIKFSRHFSPEEAVAYGIADKIAQPEDDEFAVKKDYDALLAKAKARRAGLTSSRAGGSDI